VRAITPAEIQKRLSHRLRLLIGEGRRMTLAEAADRTGIDRRTLAAYVEGRACPSIARYGRLLRVFGPEVGIELASMLGWEPRAANPSLPNVDDLRAVRDALAEAIRAIEVVLSHEADVSVGVWKVSE
jgi:transcriptional regulator with XRE-family HTH domain